jgi:hypothetical protein
MWLLQDKYMHFFLVEGFLFKKECSTFARLEIINDSKNTIGIFINGFCYFWSFNFCF